MSYLIKASTTDELLHQGDIIRQIYTVSRAPGTEHNSVEMEISNVIVLSQNCEIDKAIKRQGVVSVASVFRLDRLPKDQQGNVRKNIVLNLFFLPQADPFPIEAYVDWRTIQPIDVDTLTEVRKSDRYICTMAEETLKVAALHLWDYYFRPEPRPI